jgi:internalin A
MSLLKQLYNLSNLTVLDIQHNNVRNISKNIYDLSKLKRLDLHDNPLTHQVFPELCSKKAQFSLEYLKSIEEYSQQLNNRFNPGETMTEGINIKEWPFKLADAREVRFNLWDFDEQEIMRATHQFFLTKRSIYIIVIDARGEEDICYKTVAQ